MSSIAPQMGFNAFLYYLSTGTRATWGAAVNGVHGGAAPSSLVVCPNVKEIKIPLDATEVDVTTRGNAGWKAFATGLKDLKVTVPQIYDPTDALYLAMLKSFLTGTTIAIAILDNVKTAIGTYGIWADFAVMKREEDQPIDGAQVVAWTIAPGYSAVPPEVVNVTS
jgi:hypothetical protein